MKRVLVITGLVSAIFCCAASCSSTKKTAEATKETAAQTVNKEAMIAQGFSFGTISYSDAEGDCAYTISVDTGATFDPINLTDEFKKDGMNVWFTFRGLRRPNRCPRANPVEIVEMKKG